MADIQDLLARLKGHSAQASPAPANFPAGLFSGAPAQDVPGASPLASPGPQQATEPAKDHNADRTTNLLNLLKFNQPTASQDRPLSSRAAPTPDKYAQNGGAPGSLPRAGNPESTSRNQDLLLTLLNGRQGGPTNNVSSSSQPATESHPIQAPQPQAGGQFSFVSPFEKLAAASPARTPQPEGSKTLQNTDLLSSVEKSVAKIESPVPMADGGRTRLEALLGIGRTQPGSAQEPPKSTVSEAVEQVSSQASRDARDALARAEEKSTTDADVSAKDARRAAAAAALDIQKGLQDPEINAEVHKNMPPDMAQAFTATIESAANEAAADSWESADANEDAEGKAGNGTKPVNVYNFPMRPFTSIEVKSDAITPSSVREDVIMKIVSLKKEFDQVDRTLAAASSNFIVYAMAKGGGARVIRQDTGENKQAFRVKGNNIFNLAISAPKSSPLSSESESLLLTGINGAVYWTSLSIDQEAFDKSDIDKTGFIFPPVAPAEEPTSVSQLKTRAKKSSRHPEFFAIGRGKSIHIIYPRVATAPEYIDNKTRTVDVEKYLQERCLKISTGKAGKDFAFSEDDTMLVSLDKSGKLKFWDISAHTLRENGLPTGPRTAQDVQEPVWTLLVGSNSEKASPTSVQFLDKDRPMTKGTALRYIIVGLKQNHTIQLWDLGLGKAVQEINLPHDNDMDAICSISYNAKNGILVIGHPTRNSIYMIHLSAPRYNLDTMSQANYITRLALGDRTLPRPESTAIMSGLREISLSSIGHLRSLDVMSPNATTIEKIDAAEETIFEVYAMHSKGVTCLSLKRRDLGWSDDGKVLHPVDAQSVGAIKVTDLVESQEAEIEDAVTHQPVKLASKVDTSRPISTVSTPSKGNAAAQTNGESKSEKKKAKKRTEDPTELKPEKVIQRPIEPTSELAPPSQIKDITETSKEPSQTYAAPAETGAKAVDVKPVAEKVVDSLNNSSPSISNHDMVVTVQEALLSSVGPHFEKLYQRIKDDKRVSEATAAANQDAVLRLVSSTLTENVETSLNQIVSANIRESVTPAAANAATTSIDRKLMELVPPHLNSVVPREIKSAVQNSITQAVQSREVTKIISEQVTRNLTGLIDREFKTVLESQITPSFKALATDAASKITKEAERRLSEQLRPYELQRQRDSAMIEQLTQSTHKLLQAVEGLAATQVSLQRDIADLKAQLAEQPPTGIAKPEAHPSHDAEVDAIAKLMSDGRREDAVIKWLQSERQAELFDIYFVRWKPDFLAELNMIVLLSVSMAVSSSLKTNLAQRLDYITMILQTIDFRNSDIAQYAPSLLEVLNNKLQDEYMDIAAETPQSPLLQRLRALIVRARDQKAALI